MAFYSEFATKWTSGLGTLTVQRSVNGYHLTIHSSCNRLMQYTERILQAFHPAARSIDAKQRWRLKLKTSLKECGKICVNV